MVTLSTADINTWIAALLWPLTRILGLIAAAPILGNRAVPNTVKLLLGAMLASIVAPAVPALPAQERGLRPSRALPYALQTIERRDGEGVAIEWHNTGRAAVVLQVRDGLDAQAVPRRYTVGPGHALRDTWPLRPAGAGAPGNGQPPVATDLDLQLHGPNGLYRAWRGAGVEVDSAHLPNGRLALELRGPAGRVVDLHDRYGLLPPRRLVLPAADGTARFRLTLDLRRHRQWYDLELTDALQPAWHRRLAGRVENGHDGVSDIGLA